MEVYLTLGNCDRCSSTRKKMNYGTQTDGTETDVRLKIGAVGAVECFLHSNAVVDESLQLQLLPPLSNSLNLLSFTLRK